MKYKIIMIIFCVLLLCSASGCIYSSKREKEKWWEKEIFYYELQVESLNNSPFLGYFPVPLISRIDNPNISRPIRLMDELKILSGKGTINIIHSTHGYALEINSSNSIHIQGYKAFENESTEYDDDYAFGDLSLNSSDNISFRLRGLALPCNYLLCIVT